MGVGMGGAGCRGGVGGAKTHFLSPWGSQSAPVPTKSQEELEVLALVPCLNR